MSFVIFISGLVLIFFVALVGLDALHFLATAGVFLFSMTHVGVQSIMLAAAASSSDAGVSRAHTFLLT